MHLRDIVLSFDTYSNGASTSKRAGMRKAVWVGKSVDLQIKNEKLLQNFNFFSKTKTCLASIKKGKAIKPFLFLSKSNFILNYNWNCIANMPVFLSIPLFPVAP
tara:strand:+ start:358 stop:669 length:312 start_codon:yes stop_codon:yes gene_type:complete